MLGSDRQSGSDQRSEPKPNPNPSWSEPINFSFNSLLSFRSPIWTYNYPVRKQSRQLGRHCWFWKRTYGISKSDIYCIQFNKMYNMLYFVELPQHFLVNAIMKYYADKCDLSYHEIIILHLNCLRRYTPKWLLMSHKLTTCNPCSIRKTAQCLLCNIYLP